MPLQISNIYASGILRAFAEAFCGEVEIKYFSDEQLLCEIEKPTSHGVYYAAAYSAESENYLSLVGSGVRFEIWEVLPCGIETMLIERIFYAYERLLAEDFLISVMYNDGTAAELDSSFATVIYENGDSLRRRDTGVKISYLGFEDTCDIEVSLANYDMSGAVWENRVVEYSGREQKITLSGLPLGISVRELVGGVGTAAGEYAVTAYFDYDTENYNPPPALSAVFVIEKKKLSLPEFPPKVYSGELILPSIDENLTLSYEAEPINAGIYMLSVSVCDTLNCVFENGESVVKIPFEIKRATLTLNVENVKLHLFEGLKSPEYSVSGIMGDERVDFEFSEKDGKIYAVASNPNYEIHIVGGEIERVGYPSREYMKNIFICILLFAIIALLFFIAVRYKYPILEYIDKGKAVFFRFEKNPRPTKEDKSFSSPPLLLLPDGGGYSSIMSVDMPKADSLISDTMAKNLIKRSSCGIKTAGYKKAIVNIGVISANFSSEDTVDINKLKEKKLIPEDAGYVKVLADGIVDKPLFVYANAFSLSAVKMIALTGGEAVKVTSAKMWHRKERI